MLACQRVPSDTDAITYPTHTLDSTAFTETKTEPSDLTQPLTLLLIAQTSQPPAPRGGNEKGQPQPQQTQPGKAQPAPVERGTDANPLIVRASPSDKQTAEDQKERSDQRANRWTTTSLGAFTLAVIGFQAYLLHRQNKILTAQKSLMDSQKTIADATLATNKDIERAYIEAMHTPPGITFVTFESGNTTVTVHMRIKNRGSTPAHVTNAAVYLLLRDVNVQLPNTPEYRRERDRIEHRFRTFLVNGAEAFQGDTLTLSPSDLLAVQQTGSKGTYNYNHPRKQGEGDDWDEPAN